MINLSHKNQALNFKNKISCVSDGIFLYLNKDGKLQLLYINK